MKQGELAALEASQSGRRMARLIFGGEGPPPPPAFLREDKRPFWGVRFLTKEAEKNKTKGRKVRCPRFGGGFD